LVTPPASVKAPVLPAIEETDPADAIEDTEARFRAPDAALSPIIRSSPAAGDAFKVNAAMVENCGAALDPVKLPSKVNAAALACLATVTALLAIVSAPVDDIVASVPSVFHDGFADVCAINSWPDVPGVIAVGVAPDPPPTTRPLAVSKAEDAIVPVPVNPRIPPDVPLASAVPPPDTGTVVEKL